MILRHYHKAQRSDLIHQQPPLFFNLKNGQTSNIYYNNMIIIHQPQPRFKSKTSQTSIATTGLISKWLFKFSNPKVAEWQMISKSAKKISLKPQ